MKYYHSSKNKIIQFEKSKTVDKGFHFGTYEQAKMRNHEGYLIEVELDIRKQRRSKDMGGQWESKIKSAKIIGANSIIYLNRYEGIKTENLMNALEKGINLEKISDTEFKKLFPEAQDSIIMFNPEDIKIISINKIKPRIKNRV